MQRTVPREVGLRWASQGHGRGLGGSERPGRRQMLSEDVGCHLASPPTFQPRFSGVRRLTAQSKRIGVPSTESPDPGRGALARGTRQGTEAVGNRGPGPWGRGEQPARDPEGGGRVRGKTYTKCLNPATPALSRTVPPATCRG